MAIGGPVLGWVYKAVNTMDSMVGYKNDKYLYLGRAAAKLDDVLNFIPSRLCAWIMIFAAYLPSKGHEFDGKKCEKDLPEGPLQPCEPEFRADRVGLCRSATGAPCRGRVVLWKTRKEEIYRR